MKSRSAIFIMTALIQHGMSIWPARLVSSRRNVKMMKCERREDKSDTRTRRKSTGKNIIGLFGLVYSYVYACLGLRSAVNTFKVEILIKIVGKKSR